MTTWNFQMKEFCTYFKFCHIMDEINLWILEFFLKKYYLKCLPWNSHEYDRTCSAIIGQNFGSKNSPHMKTWRLTKYYSNYLNRIRYRLNRLSEPQHPLYFENIKLLHIIYWRQKAVEFLIVFIGYIDLYYPFSIII